MFKKKLAGILICLALALNFPATAVRGTDILFISAMDEATRPGEEALKIFMEGLGHTVTMFDDDENEADTEIAAADVPESVGKIIGIELSNTSTGDTWIGLDNIRLEVSNE